MIFFKDQNEANGSNRPMKMRRIKKRFQHRTPHNSQTEIFFFRISTKIYRVFHVVLTQYFSLIRLVLLGSLH